MPSSLASADDAVQHTFLQLRERWQEPGFLEVDPGRYCLGSVLPDYVRLQVRELKHRAGQLDASPLTELQSQESGPEEMLIQQEVGRHLRDALQQLPEKQRLAVELTAEGELSRDQVARRIGVPSVGTVSSHRARGLRKLANVLAPIVMSLGQVVAMAHHVSDFSRHLF
ncbi:sigma-70 family RNA polymerase sigma factor [Micromonospora chersina]|uniref:RNA polymerase sigma factor n=1 Tax=Micromonospora chersina TaxID=47854 RepID=UPI0034030046